MMPGKPASPVHWAAIAFLAAFLVTGLAIYKDYGISWDEIPTREFGIMNVERMVPDLRTLDSLRAVKGPAYERFGPLFEILLVRAEKLAAPPDGRSSFHLRHLLTFLTFFAGVVLFHLFCLRRFAPGIALCATVSLVATPALFSHAFYNTKDISFLSGFVAAMFTLDAVLRTPTTRAVVVHTLTTAVLMGTRVLGLFAMMLTAAAAVARRPSRRTLLELAGYGAGVLVLLPVVWPVLRVDPLGILVGAIVGSASNPYTKTDLFRGMQIPASDLPWDYIPTWIVITTPWVITALFLVGCARLAVAAARRPGDFLMGERQTDTIVLCWFFAPVLGTVVLRPVMYDAWRHLFFVYPALVYLAAVGMEGVMSWLVRRFGDARRRTLGAVAAAGFLLGLAPAVVFMIANHPYEHLYFNRLAGRDMAEIKQRFELDYWGLSYRELLEQVVRHDRSPVIRVHVANYPGIVNSVMLDAADQARLRYVQSPGEADYFITNYRFHPEPYPYRDEVFAVRVGNASVASVFRLRSGADSLGAPPR
jgi:hypothetical protein